MEKNDGRNLLFKCKCGIYLAMHIAPCAGTVWVRDERTGEYVGILHG